MRAAIRGGQSDPQTVSLIMVYSLSKALAISPLEVYKMPASLVMDLLNVHNEVETLKAEMLEKELKKSKL